MRSQFVSPWFAILAGSAMILSSVPEAMAEDKTPPIVRGTDELFWVPTLEQALDKARVTGQPIFVMGYSLVGDGSTYTKLGADYCTGVF